MTPKSTLAVALAATALALTGCMMTGPSSSNESAAHPQQHEPAPTYHSRGDNPNLPNPETASGSNESKATGGTR